MELAAVLLTGLVVILVLLAFAYAVTTSLVTRGLIHDLRTLVGGLQSKVAAIECRANELMERIEEGAKDGRREETEGRETQTETRGRTRHHRRRAASGG